MILNGLNLNGDSVIPYEPPSGVIPEYLIRNNPEQQSIALKSKIEKAQRENKRGSSSSPVTA